jgi:voltage-gated potassium channel
MRHQDIMMLLRCCLGIAGVSQKESLKVQKLGKYFEFAMLIIAIWLPIEWYAKSRGLFEPIYYQISHWVIWGAFLTETVVIVTLVKYRLYYLLTNWLNVLIICLLFPFFFPKFYLAVIIRIIRIALMFRFLVPWLTFSKSFLSKNHIGTTLIVAVLLTTISGLIVAAIDPGIPNAMAGIWWAWQTITSVGYGDVVPVTMLGRVIAIFVMILAIGLISVLTANFSAFFIEKGDKNEKIQIQKIYDIVKRLEDKIESLERKLD